MRPTVPGQHCTRRAAATTHQSLQRGLDYLNNRYHDPLTGQFISVDPLVTQTGEPYIYGNANPITYSDPWGLFSCFVPGDPWACVDLSAIVTKVGASGMTNRHDPHAPSSTAVPGAYANQTDFVMKWTATNSDGPQNSWDWPEVHHYQDGHNEIRYPDGSIGFTFDVCLIYCAFFGVYQDLGTGEWHVAGGHGGFGAGAALSAHSTSEGACEQRGWSHGGSYVPGVGGGGSVSTPLPEGGGWWTVDWGNVDAHVSVGVLGQVGGPLSGGTMQTFVAGCD